MGEPLSAASQIYFHQRLVADRQRMLEPLDGAIRSVDRPTLDAQIGRHVQDPDVFANLANQGIDPALVFPTPVVIAANPATLGYYRLLLGVSKKSFYDDALRGPFRSAEENGTYTKRHAENVDALCAAMSTAIVELLRATPTLTPRDLLSLPLLTMGAQYEGAWRVLIGQRAEADVFAAIFVSVGHQPGATRATKAIELTNDAGRRIRILRRSDPDVAVERLGESGDWELLLAMEVKGGKDRSNAHNRAGEADKSHSKTSGALHWTVSMTARLDAGKIASESSRTDEWFDVEQVRAQAGADWQRFSRRIAVIAGISPRS